MFRLDPERRSSVDVSVRRSHVNPWHIGEARIAKRISEGELTGNSADERYNSGRPKILVSERHIRRSSVVPLVYANCRWGGSRDLVRDISELTRRVGKESRICFLVRIGR